MISRVLTRCAAIVDCRWAHATECTDNGFTIDLTTTPDAARLLKWEEEKDAYVHGYWQWDWADCYGKVMKVHKLGASMIRLACL